MESKELPPVVSPDAVVKQLRGVLADGVFDEVRVGLEAGADVADLEESLCTFLDEALEFWQDEQMFERKGSNVVATVTPEGPLRPAEDPPEQDSVSPARAGIQQGWPALKQ